MAGNERLPFFMFQKNCLKTFAPGIFLSQTMRKLFNLAYQSYSMQKAVLRLLPVLLFLCTAQYKAQNHSLMERPNYKTHLEFMALPGLVFNSLSFGISKHQSEKREVAFTISSQVLFTGMSFFTFLAARANYNVYLVKRHRFGFYLPLWYGSRYINYSGNGEETGNPYQLMLYTLGTGAGIKYEFRNQHKIRVETGLGASLVAENHVYGSLKNFKIADKNAVIPACRLGIKYLIPIGKTTNQ